MRAAVAGLLALCCGAAEAAEPLPFAIGGPFALVDQHGATRTARSFHGTPVLLFFGYAACRSICATALPRLAETADLLAARGIEVQPVLITVDPARDTPEALREAAPRIHPRLIALTGTDSALAEARSAYRVESKRIGEDIEGPIFAHGSFIYLLDETGAAVSLLPPVLSPERIVEIALGYLRPAGG